MHRRHARRRLSRVAVTAAIVFAAASLVRPDRVATTGIMSDTTTTTAPSRWLGRPLARQSATPLAVQPIWKPAGEVLRRKTVAPNGIAAIGFSESHDTVHRESLSRWHRIYTFSTQYRIKADLARRIYDASVTAGIEPELGFRLVRVESVFNPRAQSPVGAVGLTQLMLGTAREFEPGVTREQLMDPDVNLRIGFKYLRTLIREYKGDLKLALLVYNRGPAAVQSALSMGVSPANGYESLMLRGYRGRGTLD
ncbi:MAG: transglycosylase SLT domain-containing protein [Gemmatimonadaceae bacterium]|nr:transglycosylase SLT domain-containing protein [Gemmatimonadaceae bacterium]